MSRLLRSVTMILSAAVAVICLVQLVTGWIYKVRTSFCCEDAVGDYDSRFVHWPLLNWLLLLEVMFCAISSASIGVKLIAVRVKIVPSG